MRGQEPQPGAQYLLPIVAQLQLRGGKIAMQSLSLRPQVLVLPPQTCNLALQALDLISGAGLHVNVLDLRMHDRTCLRFN